MTWHEIDSVFPYLVFLYGILMIFVLENKTLNELLDRHLSFYAAKFRSHRSLAWVSFFVGGIWSLQNILIMP